MQNFNRQDIMRWLKSDNPGELFAMADDICRRQFKDEVHLRGIIEFSNFCKKDCFYCGLRKSNQAVERYRMEKQETIDTAVRAGKAGLKTILLQSGEDTNCSIEQLCDIIKTIKAETDSAITLSLGELGLNEYKSLKNAGADRYLLRFETSSRELFEKLKPDSSYDNRLDCLANLKTLGFQVGSGIMVGLPGQTYETLSDDIILMRELGLDMIGIGPFLPHHNTPLAHAIAGTLDLTLRVLAIIRIVMPYVHIPATTAIGSVEKNGRQQALRCGANVIMPNITPQKYRKHYEIYPNKICIDEAPSDCCACVKGMLESLGKVIGPGRGDSIRNTKI
jgi:biotin synthase